MIEYHAHVVGLETVRRTLSAMAAPGAPEMQSADELASLIGAHPSVARLGTVLDAMLGHAASDTEVVLLLKCRDLWGRALAIYEAIGTARIEFELALQRDDIEDPVSILQMGFDRLKQAQADAHAMEAEVGALRAEVAAMPHVPAHARQIDQPSPGWQAGDGFLGRRTLAFVAALLANAPDERGRALGAGALAGFAGNVAGSAYLGHTVGGPRRLHRFRDRLARNTLGAWVHATKNTPRPSELAGEFRDATSDLADGDRLALQDDLANQIMAAFAAAYPSRPDPAATLGYRRMLEHLDLLDGFRLPEQPAPPPLVAPADGVVVTIEASVMTGEVRPQDFEGGLPSDADMGPQPDPGGSLNPGQSSSSKGGCDALMFLAGLLVAVLVYTIWCIVRAAEGEDCDPADLWDEIVGEDGTVEAEVEFDETRLALLKEPARASHLLSDVFGMQLRFWQTLEAARRALITNGLLYPDAADLGLDLHAQFLVAFTTNAWPRLGDASTEANFEGYPMTDEEQPPAPSPFPNSGPELLFEPTLENRPGAISDVARDALLWLVDPAGIEAHPNLDLDADRGWRHACWSVADGGSIHDMPLNVAVLPFASE